MCIFTSMLSSLSFISSLRIIFFVTMMNNSNHSFLHQTQRRTGDGGKRESVQYIMFPYTTVVFSNSEKKFPFCPVGLLKDESRAAVEHIFNSRIEIV